jgi:hypothetical protein
MLIKEILPKIVFGNPVAEFDKKLPDYFVITDAFQHLVSDEADIVAGDKGTGKTAIYQYLKTSYKTVPELKGVEVITGFNPSGEPIFRRLGDEAKLTEGQYVTIWKMYFLSLVGNWFLREYRGSLNPKIQRLEALLNKIGLLNSGESASTVFARLVEWLQTNATPKEVGVDISFNEFGIPVYTPKVVIGKKETTLERIPIEMISHDDAFTILDKALAEKSKIAWVVLDRLDESFVGRPDIEIPALRALIRTFMDLQPYEYVRVKLFVRKDLFRKITQEGFVNLTHVGARQTEIEWEESDLMSMICHRIRSSGEVLRYAGLSRLTDKNLFYSIFPAKVDTSLTWKWMLNQIRDGNQVRAPRNLIDLCGFAQDFQIKKDRNSNRELTPGVPIIDAESLKKAAVRLSNQRLTDTLMAEYGNDVKIAIKAFENGKVEYSEQNLTALFGFPDPMQTRLVARILCDVGFLEQVGETYRVPCLYRPALNITKGKANNGTPVVKKPVK